MLEAYKGGGVEGDRDLVAYEVDISRGPTVAHVGADGRLTVRIDFEGALPDEWRAYFDSPADSIARPISVGAPTLGGRTFVSAEVPKEDLQAYAKSIDDRVAYANQKFNAEVAPRLREDAAALVGQEAERRRSEEEAQRLLDEVQPPSATE